jgi:hypothetical protein
VELKSLKELLVVDYRMEPMDIDGLSPRGVKRKADEAALEVSAPRRIRVCAHNAYQAGGFLTLSRH